MNIFIIFIMKIKQEMVFTRIIILISIMACTANDAFPQSSQFYAYYTRLEYDDNHNTGKYADLVVHVNQTGKLVFSRENSYLPYWEVKGSKQFFERIVPFEGDGPPERPDRINQMYLT